MKFKLRIKKKHYISRSFGGNFIIGATLLILGAFMVLPMVYAVSNSLKPFDELWAFPPRFFVRNPTLKNFESLSALMSSSWVPFSRYIFNTILIAVVGTLGHLLFASLCAYPLAKHDFPGKKIIFNIIVLSLMFSTAVLSIPSFLVFSKLKLTNTLWAIILPSFASSLGLYLMKQFMEQMIPDIVLEAARIDGCSEVKSFFKIVMPMVKPAWLTLIIFSFQGLWNTGANVLIQDEQLKTLNYALTQLTSSGIARAGAAAAAGVLMMIVPIGIFIVTQSNIVETMATSGMKE